MTRPLSTTPGRAGAAVLALASALAAAPSPVRAELVGGTGFAPGSAVAAVVTVPRPWYAPRALVASRMRDTVPQYESIPGLAFKAYSFARADGQFGGVYLWKDLASARAFYGPAWFERVRTERGVEGLVRLFEVPVAIDNTAGGTPRDLDAGAVATVVTIPVPLGVGRERLVREFEASIPTYRPVPGLLRKHYVLTDDARFGGIYLWKDDASARQWFSDAWKGRVRATYGSDATIEWFDVPILLPSRLAGNAPAIAGL